MSSYYENFETMKIMQEILEFQEELRLKQQQINNRMHLLHKMKGENKHIEQFMKKIQPEYPRKISIEYSGSEPIPMKMGELYEPIPMKQAELYDPIPMN